MKTKKLKTYIAGALAFIVAFSNIPFSSISVDAASTYTVKFRGNGATSGSMADQVIEIDTWTALNNTGFKRQFTVTYNANGGSCSVSSNVADSTLLGWMDHNSYTYNGTTYPYQAFNAPYYANRYSDMIGTFGYNKLSLIDHWMKKTVNGTESRDSSEIFNVAEYLTLHSDVAADPNFQGKPGVLNHWIHYGISENASWGRLGRNSVDTTTKDYYINAPGVTVANIATAGSTIYLDAKWKDDGTVTLPTPSRTGYTFNGWYTAASGGTKVGGAGASYMPTGNITLYAQWTPITYSVVYNGNGATSGSTATSTHTYGVSKTLTSNGFSRKYTVTYQANGGSSPTGSATATATFNGWATSSSGGVSYSNGQSVSNLTTTSGGTVNLYANWKLGSVTLPTPTRDKYAFKGWYTAASGGTKVGGAGASYMPTGNITLYAQWIPALCTIEASQKIKASEINFDHGNPVFIFSATNQVDGSVYYKATQLTEADVNSPDTNGYVTATVSFVDVPAGTYVVAPVKTNRYELTSSSVSSVKIVFTETISANAAFTSTVKDYRWFGDNDLVVN